MNSNGDCNIKNQVKEDRFSEPENTAKVNMGNDSSLRFSVRLEKDILKCLIREWSLRFSVYLVKDTLSVYLSLFLEPL